MLSAHIVYKICVLKYSFSLLYSFEYSVWKFFCVLPFKQNIDRTGYLLKKEGSFNVCKILAEKVSITEFVIAMAFSYCGK